MQSLGWNSFFARAFEDYQARGFSAARVAVEHTHIYRLFSAHGDLLGEVSGRLRHAASDYSDFPAVGDWVAVAARPAEGRATIHAVLPRASCFVRKAAGGTSQPQVVAANVDTVFVMAALDHDFNARRLERYLALAWDSGARPVVVLNKADRCEDVEARFHVAARVAGAAPVHTVSALQDVGLDVLRAYIGTDQTVALLGSSGVGKSTLTNRLVGEDVQHVFEVREDDDRGRHTTTHRSLLRVPGGGLVLDTPGMRELQMFDAAEGLAETFEDVSVLALSCRFGDCGHYGEPGCAVLAAVACGDLGESRLESWRKLQREQRFVTRRVDQRAMLEERRKWKNIHKAAREHYKSKRG